MFSIYAISRFYFTLLVTANPTYPNQSLDMVSEWEKKIFWGGNLTNESETDVVVVHKKWKETHVLADER